MNYKATKITFTCGRKIGRRDLYNTTSKQKSPVCEKTKLLNKLLTAFLFTTKVHHQHRTAKLNKLPKWTYVKEQNIPGNIAWIVVSKSFQGWFDSQKLLSCGRLQFKHSQQTHRPDMLCEKRKGKGHEPPLCEWQFQPKNLAGVITLVPPKNLSAMIMNSFTLSHCKVSPVQHFHHPRSFQVQFLLCPLRIPFPPTLPTALPKHRSKMNTQREHIHQSKTREDFNNWNP